MRQKLKTATKNEVRRVKTTPMLFAKRRGTGIVQLSSGLSLNFAQGEFKHAEECFTEDAAGHFGCSGFAVHEDY